MPDALSALFIIVILFIAFVILYGIFGEVIIYIYLAGAVIEIFEYFFGSLTFVKIICILTIGPFLCLFFNRFIKIPLSYYDGTYTNGDSYMKIRVAGDEIEIQHNLNIDENTAIEVKWRELVIGSVKITLVRGGIKLQFEDKSHLIMFEE